MRVKLTTMVVAACAAMILPGYGSIIVNPTGWSNNGGTIDYTFDRTFDNSGLDTALTTGQAVPGTLPLHALPGNLNGGGGAYNFEDVAGRFTSLGGGTATLTYDLGGSYELESLLLWNGAEYWYAYYNGRGLAGATLEFSTDGVTFSGSEVIAPARLPDVLTDFAAEEFTFASPITAQYVRFSGLSNHDGSDAHTEISEVKFTAIPEPATLGMVALFGGGILFLRRRLAI